MPKPATVSAGDNVEGRVVGVTDGNTLTLLIDKTQYQVRLWGVAAPKLGQPFGVQAKKALSDKVLGKTVEVWSQGRDMHGHNLGVVLANGCVNTQLVKEGFAWHNRKHSSSKALAEDEEKARAAKAGLWADPKPIPPWDWREASSATGATDPFVE